VHWNHTHLVTKKKRKRKEMTKRNFNKWSKAKGKAKNKVTWRRQVMGPLGKGNDSTQPRQKQAQAKSKRPPKQSSKTTKNSLCTHASSPLNQCNSPWTNACKPLHKIEQLHQPCSHRSDRSAAPFRSVHQIAQHQNLTLVRLVASTDSADGHLGTARAKK
jgi:hypothetical protein